MSVAGAKTGGLWKGAHPAVRCKVEPPLFCTAPTRHTKEKKRVTIRLLYNIKHSVKKSQREENKISYYIYKAYEKYSANPENNLIPWLSHMDLATEPTKYQNSATPPRRLIEMVHHF